MEVMSFGEALYNKNKMKDYHINIFYSEEDGGDIADIPDLVHCSAFGDTPEEALAQGLVAKTAWLDAAKAENKPIPSPKYRPAIYQLSVSTGLRQIAEEKAKYK